MTDFTSIACGVVKNVGTENEERFIFIAQDSSGNEYSMSEIDPTYIVVVNETGSTKINRTDEYNSFLAECFLYLCKCSFKQYDAVK